MSWKNTGDIDQEIQRQERVAESSNATLVDQKKAIAEISSLRKQKKAFGGFDEAQRNIDKVKADIAEMRKQLDNPEAKALSQRFDEADRELKAIKAEQDEAYKGLHSLRDERSKAYAEQQEKWAAMKDIKDQYFKANRAYRDWDQEQYKMRQEKQKAERDAYQKEKRRKIADKKLEEASEPAYMDEILTTEGLIRYFDPSSPEASKSLRGPSGFAAEAQRSVDTNSDFKGTRVSKKEDREDTYFMGTGGKKGKKGKKGSAAGSPAPGTPTEGKFNLSIGIIEELAKVNVEPPMSQAGVPAVTEKLKEKRDHWKKDQDRKTKEVRLHLTEFSGAQLTHGRTLKRRRKRLTVSKLKPKDRNLRPIPGEPTITPRSLQQPISQSMVLHLLRRSSRKKTTLPRMLPRTSRMLLLKIRSNRDIFAS